MLKDPKYGFKLFIGGYEFASSKMSKLYFMEFHAGGAIKTLITADSGAWTPDGAIRLERATRQRFSESGAALGRAEALTGELMKTSLGPYDLVEARAELTTMRLPALTFSDLRRLTRENPRIPQFRVMLFGRLAEPLVPFLLLLVGIPLLVGFESSTESRLLGIVICILVAASFHLLSFVCMSMGNTGVLNPILAPLLPHLVLGPVGIYLFTTMRT
jgi:lipopolysaccharide export LptBFGC system permease protein LptF